MKLPHLKPPVTPGTTTRYTVAPAGTRSSNNGAIVYGPCVAPAGPAAAGMGSRNKEQSSRQGGQHSSSVGISTADQTDREDTAERLADFNAELERLAHGVVCGRAAR